MIQTRPTEERLLSDISDAQKLFVVALRHCAYLGPHLVAHVFHSRLLPCQLDSLVKSFSAVVNVLQLASGDKPLLNSPGSGKLSAVEVDLLGAVALVQGRVSVGTALQQMKWLDAELTAELAFALLQVAEDLITAQLYLPSVVKRKPNRGFWGAPRNLPAAEKLSDLHRIEKQLVVAVRLCAHTLMKQLPTTSTMATYLAPLGLSDLVDPINSAMRVLAEHTLRAFDVRCIGCANISDDEARILAAIAFSQSDNDAQQTRMARAWLIGPHDQGFMCCVDAIASSLSWAEHFIPQRRWSFLEEESKRPHLRLVVNKPNPSTATAGVYH
ncbi:MAG: hypothetical protein AAF434_13805 [Pseudomonadota bacterium]